MEIKLKKDEILYTEPRVFLYYGPEKIGKTTILSQLPNCGHLDTEKGSGFVSTIRYEINSLQDLADFRDAHIAAGYPHTFIGVDTITKMEDWSNKLATDLYMGTTAGKLFNRDNRGKLLPEEEWNGVYEALGQNALMYVRRAWRMIFDDYLFPACGNTTKLILIGHIKDKYMEGSNNLVSSKELDLTGRLKNITLQHMSDSNSYCYRDSKGDLMFSFKAEAGDISAGSRVGPFGQIIPANKLWETLYPDTLKTIANK